MKLIQQVRNKIDKKLLQFACWIFKRAGIDYALIPDSALQTTVSELVTQVEEKFGNESGEYKRSKVLLAVMQVFPEALERDISFAIELEIRKYV